MAERRKALHAVILARVLHITLHSRRCLVAEDSLMKDKVRLGAAHMRRLVA